MIGSIISHKRKRRNQNSESINRTSEWKRDNKEGLLTLEVGASKRQIKGTPTQQEHKPGRNKSNSIFRERQRKTHPKTQSEEEDEEEELTLKLQLIICYHLYLPLLLLFGGLDSAPFFPVADLTWKATPTLLKTP